MSSEHQPLKSNSHDGYAASSYNCNGGDTSSINNHTVNNNTTKEDVEYKISSLDFERVINEYSINSIQEKYSNQSHHHSKHYADTKQTAIRWILTILAGLLTGLTSVLLVTCTGTIVKWRARIVYQAGE